MGVDFSHQNVISKTNNLLVEELSAYYYLQAFYRLANRTPVPHILPATGADNLPMLANLMLGWGLEFGVLLDDDLKGREIKKRLLSETMADDETALATFVAKVPGKCIEAVFTKQDLRTFILEDPAAQFDDVCEHMKGFKKGVLALGFYNRVCDSGITSASLQTTTLKNIEKLLTAVDRICNLNADQNA
jgi:hypothetical protein